jgi:Fe-S oxidoreductase
VPGLAALSERLTGLSAARALPRWSRRPFRLAELQDATAPAGTKSGGGAHELPYAVFAVGGDARPARDGPPREVALFADTFNTYFEPDNLRATAEVLTGLGYRIVPLAPADGGRPVCCGRTFLAAGLVDEARAEARRLLVAARPHLDRGVPIVGIEPSCLLTLRDEALVMGLGADAERLAAGSLLLEEHLARDADAGHIAGPIGRLAAKVHLHGHCHQKAFGAMPAIERILRLVEGLEVRPVESSCCGMAGAFGYRADTHEMSLAMGEASLLPAVRAAAAADLVAADGFSCRHQIADGAGREALHVAQVLKQAMRVTTAAAKA